MDVSMKPLKSDNPIFLLDTEFFYNNTGIGQDSKIILAAIRGEWSTRETSSLDWFAKSGPWKRKLLTLLWVFKWGSLRAAGFPGAIFYQSQIGLLNPPRDSKDWIIRVHDLFPITNPEWFHVWDRFLFKSSLDKALDYGAGFIVNSQTTKDALCGYAKQKIRVEVLPCAVRPLIPNLCSDCEACEWLETEIPEQFAIALGTLEPRKNYLNLIRSWGMRSENEWKLIIIGKIGWKSQKIRMALRVNQQVVHLKSCCDGSLDAILKKSSVFLSASFAEGFDLPAMEARQLYRLPLILSDIPVHREFHSDVAYFFNHVSELADLDLAKIKDSNVSNYLVRINPVEVIKRLKKN